MFIGKIILLSAVTVGAPILAETAPTSSVVENTTTSSSVPEEDLPPVTEDDLIDIVTEYLSKYLNTNLVADIINWGINIGLFSFATGVYLKYRKYKSLSSKEIAKEVENKINECLKESFKNMSQEELALLSQKIDKFSDNIDILKEALVLAQDKTAEGKIALLKLVSESSKENTEVVQKAEEVTEIIKEEQNIDKEIQEKVQDTYLPID